MIRDAKGITLIALAITIIVMLIILGVTTTTVMDSYKNTKIQNFAAEMRVIQAGVDKFYSEYRNWEEYTENDPTVIEQSKIVDYANSFDILRVPYDERTYNGSKKVKDMAEDFQAIINDVRVMAEHSFATENIEGADILGYEFRNEDVDVSSYYYLTPEDMETLFGLKNLSQNVLVNFFTRNVISVNGIKTLEKDEDGNVITVYREYDLPRGQHLLGDVKVSPDSNIILRAQALRNNNEFQDVLLSFTPKDSTIDLSVLDKIKKIKGVYYVRFDEETYEAMINDGRNNGEIDSAEKTVDKYLIDKFNKALNDDEIQWRAVGEYKYNNEDKTIICNVKEAGVYYFMVGVDEFDGKVVSYKSEDLVYVAIFNKPIPPVDVDYLPVKFITRKEVKKEVEIYGKTVLINQGFTVGDGEEIVAVVCTPEDPDWYDYSPNGNSKWANIMLLDGDYNINESNIIPSGTDGKYKIKDSTDTVVPEVVLDVKEKYGSIFVWIPRYSYSSPLNKSGLEYTVDVRFIGGLGVSSDDQMIQPAFRNESKGNANDTGYKKYYNDGDTIKDVGENSTLEGEYAFGGWRKELKGMWVAKFNSSRNLKDGKTTMIVPGIKCAGVGEKNLEIIQNEIKNKKGLLQGPGEGLAVNFDPHFTKESEWGMIGLFACSKYGRRAYEPISIPTNFKANYAGGYENLPDIWNKGDVLSSTGNAYGIYDIMESEMGCIVASWWDPDSSTSNQFDIFYKSGTNAGGPTEYVLRVPSGNKPLGKLKIGGGALDFYNVNSMNGLVYEQTDLNNGTSAIVIKGKKYGVTTGDQLYKRIFRTNLVETKKDGADVKASYYKIVIAVED